MRVVVMGATKGGVGKTTIGCALAAEGCRRRHRVGILDVDPQQSMARWHELRIGNAPELEDKPVLVEAGHDRSIVRALSRIDEAGLDWLIIDTPPALIHTIEPAVHASHLVVIPLRASPIDVESVDPIVELSIEHGKDFVFLLNATMPRAKSNEGVRVYLNQLREELAAEHRGMVGGDVLEIEIVNRLLYATAMIKGSTAPEAEPKGPAASEIAALWVAIEKRLDRATAKKKR